jgi:glycosyltransferase involved in cell wall biosynthesis
MKIMYIANGNGLSDKVGGSLIRTINMAKRLKEKGCEVYFLTTIGGYKACKRKGLTGVNYHILPASLWKKEETNMFDRFLSYIISTLASIFVIFRLPKVDIVYSDSDYFCDTIPAVLYKLRYKSKWIAITHHRISIIKNDFKSFVITLISSEMQTFSYNLFKKYADKILILKTGTGRMIKRLLTSKGISSSKFEYVLNGVDMRLIKSVPEKQKIYDGCFLGGLRPNKGLYEIVPIWRNVCEIKKDAKLILIGHIDPIYLKELKKNISENKLEQNIKILGFVDSERKKIEYLKSSKVFIFPSLEEGFGIAALEAMACGLPVVAWNLPVYREVFPKGMVRVPIGDIKKFADEVLRLLNDPELYEKMRSEATEMASKYDWNEIAKKELEFIKRTIY